MVDRLNTAEGVTSGTTVTTGNSGTYDAFEAISGNPTFSDEWSAFGAQSLKYSGAASSVANLTRWAPSSLAVPTLRFAGYLHMPAFPTASTCAVVQFRNGSGTVASFLVGTSGNLQFLDSASGGAVSLYGLTAGTPVFITGKVTKGTTTANGAMECEVRSLDGATLLASYSSAARNIGTADLVAVQFGRLTSAAGATLYWDQVRFSPDGGALYPPWVDIVQHPASGTVSAVSAVSGNLSQGLAGVVESSTLVTGQATTQRPVTGTVASVSTVSGDVTAQLDAAGGLAGTITATSSVAGAVTSRRPVDGNITSSSSITGSITAMLPITGQITATSTASGTMDVPGGLTGTVTATSAVTGNVTARLAMSGTVDTASAITGAVAMKHAVYGAVLTVSSITGDMIPGGLPPIPARRVLIGAANTRMLTGTNRSRTLAGHAPTRSLKGAP